MTPRFVVATVLRMLLTLWKLNYRNEHIDNGYLSFCLCIAIMQSFNLISALNFSMRISETCAIIAQYEGSTSNFAFLPFAELSPPTVVCSRRYGSKMKLCHTAAAAAAVVVPVSYRFGIDLFAPPHRRVVYSSDHKQCSARCCCKPSAQ